MKKVYFLLAILLYLVPGKTNAQFSILHSFNFTDGDQPQGSVILLGSRLYGCGLFGGANLDGCIYSIDTNGTGFKVLYSYTNASDGGYSTLQYASGKFYGMAQVGKHDSGNVFSIDTNGNNFKDLFDFTGPNGWVVARGQLVISGYKLYGMTYGGGAHHWGTIFSMDTNGGGYKDMHDFNGTDGGNNYGSLLLVRGKLYGMTINGGTDTDGVIFSIDTSGAGYRVLHNFNGTAGQWPAGSLTLLGNTLYGTTTGGGLAPTNGTIFSMDTNGSRFTDLFNFNGMNGEQPYCSLTIFGSTMYGLSQFGGVNNDGCIFSIDTNGSTYTDLWDFNGANGNQPLDNLLLAGNTFYGTATNGGYYNNGDIFKFKDTAIKRTETFVNNIKSTSGYIDVYPNPFTNTTTIALSSGGTHYLELDDLTGRKLRWIEFTGTQYELQAQDLAKGIYFIRAYDSDKNVIGTSKIVVQ